MKNRLLSLIVAGSVAGLIPATSMAKDMHPVLNQLDLDGEHLSYDDTSGLIAYVNTMIDIFSSAAKMEAPEEEVDQTVAIIKKALNDSGILSIDYSAMSSKQLDNGLCRNISIMDYGEADAQKLLWRIIASEPTALKGIQYAPADTVCMVNSTASLSELWKVFNEVVGEYVPAESQHALNEELAMAQMMLGTGFQELFDSVDNEILVTIQLSEKNECMIPSGNIPLSIPEPSALIGFKTKSPLLSNLILKKLQEAGAPVVDAEKDGFTLHTLSLPFPSPVPFAPTFVQTDDYLLIGTTSDVVANALESRKNKNGLIATPLYKKLLADAPAQTSEISFLSPRLANAIMGTVNTLLENIPEASMAEFMSQLFGGWADFQFGEYVIKNPTGFYVKRLGSSAAAGGISESMTSAATMGLLAAIGIPSFEKARETSIEKACENNCRIIEGAKMQWAIDNGKMDGEQPTEDDLNPYIDGGFYNVQCPSGASIEINPVGTRASCPYHSSEW